MASARKKLNIAVIVGPFPCTSETFILNHITALIDLGHEVDIFAFGRSKEEQIEHEDVRKYGLDKKVTYLFPLPSDRKVRRARILEAVLKNIFISPARIWRCFRINYFEKITPSNLLIFTAYFSKRRYDVIHAHFGPNAQKMSFMKDIMDPVKFIVTFHGYDIRRGLAEGEGYYSELFKRADHVIAICNYNKEKLQKLGCPASKIVSMSNIVNTRLFSSDNRAKSAFFTITTVARFVPEKNYEFALKILKALKDDQTGDFRYIVVGDGALKADVEAMVKEFGLEEVVVFKGALKQDEVKDVLNQTDLFLLSSRNEILPTVVLEAQSMGIPVVATDVGGLRETMIDGKTGFLVAPDDVQSAKDRILTLMKDPALRESFGKAAKEFIRENFDRGKLSQGLADLYER